MLLVVRTLLDQASMRLMGSDLVLFFKHMIPQLPQLKLPSTLCQEQVTRFSKRSKFYEFGSSDFDNVLSLLACGTNYGITKYISDFRFQHFQRYPIGKEEKTNKKTLR